MLYGIFRYLYLVHQKRGGGSPTTMLLTDRPLLGCVALWIGTVIVLSVLAVGELGMSVVTTEAPSAPATAPIARTARVAVVRTTPETVLEDYARVMDLAGYRDTLSRDRDTLVKLNLSWTKYFPSCSSQPWQVDGVLSARCWPTDSARTA